ncbi:class I SAM-dependent methyltransferase [Streptomyces sp. 71268]|uniref:class I SAM-dependent methyltransferase n=1 Tax=Streptomyces sp. 71268 TaxID=3002640 RepID=UPI0023F78E73|nr:class I SAM-dependent methyltransferase [Streptomyces sp. 71268]WEV29236.1 class I SAM-dependent methyltransferase [Streptomyces sp. 71268]
MNARDEMGAETTRQPAAERDAGRPAAEQGAGRPEVREAETRRAEVRRLYERFPYPSPTAESGLLHDVANAMGFLLADGRLGERRVLDAGCGTGHRLVALAKGHPEARFVGVDASAASLAVARALADRHGVRNVEFRQGLVPGLTLPETFDLVVCTGLVHHLPDPRAGLRWLVERLADDGLLYLWLYHALGEHDRLLDRELVRLLDDASGTGSGLETVRALGLTLAEGRYGANSESAATAETRHVIDADAYLHPVVHAWRFGDLPGLLAGLDLDWVSAFSVNYEGGSRFVDLAGLEDDPYLCVTGAESLPYELADRLTGLSNPRQLQVLELRLRPTGFSLAAGRGDSLRQCAPRVAGSRFLDRRTTAPTEPTAAGPRGDRGR